MRKFVNQENCNAILAALTTFRRVSIRFENGENKKDEKFPTITSLLKENGVGHNYHSFIRDILVERKLVSVDLKKWNKQKAEPNIEMAKSIAQEAASKLCTYQKSRREARKQLPIEYREVVDKGEAPQPEEKPTISDVYKSAQKLKELAFKAGLTVEINIIVK